MAHWGSFWQGLAVGTSSATMCVTPQPSTNSARQYEQGPMANHACHRAQEQPRAAGGSLGQIAAKLAGREMWPGSSTAPIDQPAFAVFWLRVLRRPEGREDGESGWGLRERRAGTGNRDVGIRAGIIAVGRPPLNKKQAPSRCCCSSNRVMICCHPRLLFTARTRPRGPVTIPKRESRGEERRGGRGGGGGGERSCCCCNTKGRDALGAVCLAASSREIAFVQPEANQQTRTVQNEGASSIRRVDGERDTLYGVLSLYTLLGAAAAAPPDGEEKKQKQAVRVGGWGGMNISVSRHTVRTKLPGRY
ncbi:uncharacterized protein CIMG_13329 [Coccidioides immitis RS]|uniref:Uncharacterized protein n=1 Tax=Coccidioides immitis (strain RS) TaxID=246410 RepID=A0A0D8JUW0_COCIM|nr:uncharacterized protein CIMG_13329 [Coccidioides immitis RS]KJF60934.1 hypothetical protein CIMG_13329 [Coccidioides immitis RS]